MNSCLDMMFVLTTRCNKNKADSANCQFCLHASQHESSYHAVFVILVFVYMIGLPIAPIFYFRLKKKAEALHHQEKNLIKENPTGFYSSLIRLTEEKNNPRYYKSPKCLKSRGFKKNYFNNNKVIETVNRTNMWLSQTPQAFCLKTLRS